MGDLVLMATAPYEDAASNPGLQLMMQWTNRIAPGFKHDIFAELAWSAGMAFLQAAKAVGPAPHPGRPRPAAHADPQVGRRRRHAPDHRLRQQDPRPASPT